MSISSSTSYSKMSKTRGRSSGWASFDVKHQQIEGLKPELDVDPFPPMSDTDSAGLTRKLVTNNVLLTRPFSSVVRPSSDFPVLTSGSKSVLPINSSNRNIRTQIVEESSMTPILAKLKQLYSWADNGLISDVLTAVNNDEEQASALLKDMVFSEFSERENNLTEPSSAIEKCVDEKFELVDEVAPLEKQPSDHIFVKLISGNLYAVPIEPEWEEEDVYVSHRKEAIKMMRSASKRSHAASNAFLRGDHLSAQQLSSEARGEWLAAEELNAKAAKEILHIRNAKNDMWKLDLHGLHASEAVHALEEHLHRIETQMPMNRCVSSDALSTPGKGILHTPSSVSTGALDIETCNGNQQALPARRQTILQVITGTGNHSRGQAALPTAVRSFLIENGYRFDDARPGVFAVRPKFRQGLFPKS